MTSQEPSRDRLARYLRLMESISDERAIRALQGLCDELQAKVDSQEAGVLQAIVDPAAPID